MRARLDLHLFGCDCLPGTISGAAEFSSSAAASSSAPPNMLPAFAHSRQAALRQALESKQPTLINVAIDPQASPGSWGVSSCCGCRCMASSLQCDVSRAAATRSNIAWRALCPAGEHGRSESHAESRCLQCCCPVRRLLSHPGTCTSLRCRRAWRAATWVLGAGRGWAIVLRCAVLSRAMLCWAAARWGSAVGHLAVRASPALPPWPVFLQVHAFNAPKGGSS